MQERELPAGWDQAIPTFPAGPERHRQPRLFGQVENAIAQHLPWLIGGAADLAPSTKTRHDLRRTPATSSRTIMRGRNLHFGVREHAMGAAVNGMALAKLRPFGSGFLIFSDYMRNPIRLSAIMELPVALHLHARLDRRRRGRTDPPAG